MLLTYSDRKFILKNASYIAFDSHTVKWTYEEFERWSTTDYKAADVFRQYADDKAKKILNRAIIKRYPAPNIPLPRFLDPHQDEGVTWVLTRSRSYLAHAPGAGKTCEAIVASLFMEPNGNRETILFIVPPTLTANWERELTKFHDLLGFTQWIDVFIIPESKRQETVGWSSDFIICPDSMLTKDWVLDGLEKLTLKFVAVDEASRFKEASSERTKALFGGTLDSGRKCKGLVYEARHAVLLDGSPMPNRPMELWAPTYAMCPEAIDFMSQEEFGQKFCGATWTERGWEYKYSSNENELRERLQKEFMHVVPESWLCHPERLRSLIFVNKEVRTPKQQTFEQKWLGKWDGENISEKYSMGENAKYRRETGLKKVPFVSEYVRDRLKNKNESILLFAWHIDVVMDLAQRLSTYRPGVVMGGTHPKDREKFFSEFQSGERKLLIMNIAAGGRGHNLQNTDRVIFAEYSWTDEYNTQCEKRASRRGSTKQNVRCEYIVLPDSMDEAILNAVMRKQKTVKRIIG